MCFAFQMLFTSFKSTPDEFCKRFRFFANILPFNGQELQPNPASKGSLPVLLNFCLIK